MGGTETSPCSPDPHFSSKPFAGKAGRGDARHPPRHPSLAPSPSYVAVGSPPAPPPSPNPLYLGVRDTVVALPSLGDVAPASCVTSCFLNPSARARGGSGCGVLLGGAWVDRLELGTALKPCCWHGDVTAGCRLAAPLSSCSWKRDCHFVSGWDVLESLA